MLKFSDGLPSDIRLGETKVKAIYFNETLVSPSTPIVTPYLEYTTVQNPDTWIKVDYTGKTEIPNEAYR